MEKLESLLDIEVKTYLQRVKSKEEVKDLVSGNLTRETYARFLFTFYIIEFLSQRAVNMASINTKDSDPLPEQKVSFLRTGRTRTRRDCPS